MDNSTSITVQLTPLELWTQLIVFYGLLCGIVSTACSVLIWYGIIRRKNLRTRFFIIVGCLTFCRTLICLQFLIMAIYRSLRTLGFVSPDQKRIVCHTIHFWLINGWTLEMFLLCALVVDRMIAIVAINRYRHMKSKSAFTLCLVLFVTVSIAKLVPSYSFDNMLEIRPCVNLYSFLDHRFNEFSQYIDLIMVLIILICYLALIVITKLKVRRMRGNQEATDVALRRQLKLMPMLRNLVLMHCTLAFTSKLLLFLANILPRCQQRCTAYGGVLSCIDVFTNVFVLLFTNSDIRSASLPCFYKQVSQVSGASRLAKNTITNVVALFSKGANAQI